MSDLSASTFARPDLIIVHEGFVPRSSNKVVQLDKEGCLYEHSRMRGKVKCSAGGEEVYVVRVPLHQPATEPIGKEQPSFAGKRER